jgi:chromosome segregation ATPase
MDMVTIDELESRLRFVEADMKSEKEVSLATLQQAVRNSAVLNTLRTRFDELGADMVPINGELRSHSTLMPVLTQDIAAIRNDVTALRRGQEELHVRIDQTNVRLEQFQADTNARFDRLEARFDALEARFDALEARFDALEARFDVMERNVAAILAAVAPGSRPPA